MSAVHAETEHTLQSLINDVVCGGMCAEQLMSSVTLPFQLSLLLVWLHATATNPQLGHANDFIPTQTAIL